MGIRGQLRRLTILVGVLALIASSCSSDSSENAADDTTTTTVADTTAATPDEPTEQPTEAPTEEAVNEGSADATEPPTPEEAVHMELPDYPLFETTVIAEDQAYLDQVSAEFLVGLDGAEPDLGRFLFGALPLQVFDTVFAGDAGDDLATQLWIMHLSGYFGGRWLRGEIAAAQPDAPLVGFSQQPTEESFGATMDRAQIALDAAAGTDEEALTYAATTLRTQAPQFDGDDPEDGLTDNFGYNQGYQLEILASPPEGVATNPAFVIECEGLFGCTYATERLAALTELAAVQAAIMAAEEPYTDLVAELLPVQEEAIPRGKAVWSGGLSVQGFSQASYDQLLDVSSSYLEMVHASALTAAQASIEGNAEQARIAALAHAVIIVWLAGYYAGLTNGEGEIVLPEFA